MGAVAERASPDRVMWDTSCLDWKERILDGKRLIPELPLFEDQAAKALRIFKRLRVPDIIDSPTYGEVCRDWVFDLVAAIFGSYDERARRRILREFFVMLPKKNGKSSIAAAIIVTAAIMNVRPEAELLLIAPTKKIADIAYKQAAGIIRLDRELTKLFHPQTHQRTITHRLSLAAIIIKAADTDVITGSKATFILIDETHVFAEKSKANEVFIEIRGSLASRPDGFLLQITTQSKRPPTGVFLQELATARDVRDGKLSLPLLPVLYELPHEICANGGWKNPKYWPLVNPNLGASVDEAFLQDELTKAERDGAAQLALIASQHFNVQIGMGLRSDGWAGAIVWERGIEIGLDLDEILRRCEVVAVGIDGGGLDDLLGIGLIGRERGTKRWLGWAHALISDIGIERRKANIEQYDRFERDGDLTKFVYTAPVEDRRGALPINIQYVVDLVGRIRDLGLLAQVGVDAAGIGAIVDALADIGVSQDAESLDAVRQGIALMGAIKTIEIKLADYSFRHGGSAMLAWCVGNLRVVPTPTAMRVARDESGYGKVDPAMALFNAAHLMALNPQAGGSVYTADRGLLIVAV
jgi:phage terminase large subunit-like protein